MRKILLLIVFLLSFFTTFAQCPFGSICLYTQDDVDNFFTNYPGYTELTETLRIEGAGITNLAPLNGITSADGLQIYYTSLTNLDGLETLTTLERLEIFDNDLLLDINGLSGISTVDLYLGIQKNANLSSLTPLSGLNSAINFVVINELDSLTSLSGLENISPTQNIVISYHQALTDISAIGQMGLNGAVSLNINNNTALVDFTGLESITSLRRLSVFNNSSLSTMNGLQNLQTVQNRVSIANNDMLTDISDLNPNSVGSFLLGQNDSLESLDGPESVLINGVSERDFRIYDNPLLNDITALENWDFSQLNASSLFQIENNPALSMCNVTSICSFLESNPPSTVVISGNAPGCEDEPAVISACGVDINIVSGAALFDFNVDGCDPLDVVAPGLLIETTDGTNTFATFTNNLGDYQNFVQAEGTVSTSINPASLPPFFAATPASQDSNFTGFGNEDIIDFCITATQTINDLKISLIPLFDPNPGFDTPYQIVYENMGTTQLSGQVDLTIDTGRQTFVSSTPTETSNAGDVITWDYVDLNPFETRTINFTLNNFPPPTNQIGDEVGLSVEILPDDQDATPQDNAVSIKQNYVGSYDPNDKRVVQGAEIPEAMVGEYLDYIIRFLSGSFLKILREVF